MTELHNQPMIVNELFEEELAFFTGLEPWELECTIADAIGLAESFAGGANKANYSLSKDASGVVYLRMMYHRITGSSKHVYTYSASIPLPNGAELYDDS